MLLKTLSFWLFLSNASLALPVLLGSADLTLTFFSLFGILGISSCELLLSVPIVYHEVDSALSFQTILFSRFSALGGGAFRCEPLPFRRFINVSTLPRVVKRFCRKFSTFFEAISRKDFHC